MRSQENLFGAYAILFGVVISVILGLVQAFIISARQDWIYVLLAIIGFFIGITSVGDNSKDATTFLLASISLVIVGSMGQEVLSVGQFGSKVSTILDTMLTMFIPATIIVALKVVFSIVHIK